ncbi:unnamed protein product [Effrenium voratum]|nr:unnamed protein product [Effrenium voratum]
MATTGVVQLFCSCTFGVRTPRAALSFLQRMFGSLKAGRGCGWSETTDVQLGCFQLRKVLWNAVYPASCSGLAAGKQADCALVVSAVGSAASEPFRQLEAGLF